MRPSMVSHLKAMKNKKTSALYLAILATLILTAFTLSLCVGKYPITFSSLLSREEMAVRVFFNLRLPRACMGLFGGFGLGIAGFVYQTVFGNPLASPDIIGVSSGASVGAAWAILFVSSRMISIISCAFIGGLASVFLALLLASLVRDRRNTSIVLAGIAVQALAQTILMCLKLMADPERELASIEYWIMGSLSGITASRIPAAFLIVAFGCLGIFLLYRHIILLSVSEEEGRMLGLSTGKMRTIVLILATLIVAAIISVTGLISFVGLLAPHTARLLLKHNRRSAMLLSGMMGSFLLLTADTLAKGIASSEFPVSIFTSMIGAPFLIYLIISERRKHE